MDRMVYCPRMRARSISNAYKNIQLRIVIMALLEQRIKQPGVARRHEGRVAVATSNTRWCSDGFEFRCEDGAKLSVTFALDCYDRDAIGWVASPTGYSGDDIRDLMLEAVEKRFGEQAPATPVR